MLERVCAHLFSEGLSTVFVEKKGGRGGCCKRGVADKSKMYLQNLVQIAGHHGGAVTRKTLMPILHDRCCTSGFCCKDLLPSVVSCTQSAKAQDIRSKTEDRTGSTHEVHSEQYLIILVKQHRNLLESWMSSLFPGHNVGYMKNKKISIIAQFYKSNLHLI